MCRTVVQLEGLIGNRTGTIIRREGIRDKVGQMRGGGAQGRTGCGAGISAGSGWLRRFWLLWFVARWSGANL